MNGGLPDYYALLGISANADGDAIRAAYRALAKLQHPDVAEGETAEATEQFVRLQEAYDVLGDPDRRLAYDLERARRAAIDEAMRLQRATIAERQATAAAPPAWRSASNLWTYALVLGLVAGIVSLIVAQRWAAQREQEDQITVIRVDPPRAPAEARRGDKAPAGIPPDLGVLSREIDRLNRLQVERVEAAKKKLEAEVATARKRRTEPPAIPPPAPAPVEIAAKVDCSGEGRSFVLTHQDDATSVSFNGGPFVRPAINDTGTGIVVVTQVEPTNRIALGFLKGDKDRTVILISDAVGNIFRSFAVECTGAAF